MTSTKESSSPLGSSYLAGNELDSGAIAKDYRPTEARTWLRLFIDALLLSVGIVASVMALDFVPLARYFALFASGGVTIVAAINLVVDVWHTLKGVRAHDRRRAETTQEANEALGDNGAARSATTYFASMVGAALAMAVFGLPVGGAIFVFLFLKYGAGWRLRSSLIGGAAICFGTISFGFVLDMRWPPSLLGLEQYIMQLFPF